MKDDYIVDTVMTVTTVALLMGTISLILVLFLRVGSDKSYATQQAECIVEEYENSSERKSIEAYCQAKVRLERSKK